MVLICSRFCAVFTETSITFSYGVCFRRMTTQNFQKKHAHLNLFTKNQGRPLGASPLAQICFLDSCSFYRAKTEKGEKYMRAT
jgi:hypothetical protein